MFGDADATSTLNLRGLGAKRSLVLVNGKRFIGAGPNGVVDVNNIPSSLVERVRLSLDAEGKATEKTVSAVTSLVAELAAGVRQVAKAAA